MLSIYNLQSNLKLNKTRSQMSSGEKFIVIEFEGPSFMSNLETIYIYIHTLLFSKHFHIQSHLI